MMANMPLETKIFVDKYADLVVLIQHILKEKGYTQKLLAEKMDKTPSEIHKWLSGEHNFTLRSIAKLEAELGETLLEVPKRKNMGNTVYSDYGVVRLEKYESARKQTPMPKGNWSKAVTHSTKTILANAG